MTNISVRNSRRKPVQLDLLEILQQPYVLALPWPAQRLCRRHGLAPAIALVIAREMGFAIDEVRQ